MTIDKLLYLSHRIFVNRTIENIQAKIPALERSIQEIRHEGELS